MAVSDPTGRLTWDLVAIRQGAAVCLVFAIPFSIAAQWADGNDDGGLAFLFSLCALGGFVLGSGVAAWAQDRSLPFAHALITASSTYLAAQVVFIAVKLIRGDEVNFFAALFNLMATLFAGVLGGVLGMVLLRNGVRPTTHRREDDGR